MTVQTFASLCQFEGKKKKFVFAQTLQILNLDIVKFYFFLDSDFWTYFWDGKVFAWLHIQLNILIRALAIFYMHSYYILTLVTHLLFIYCND